MKKCRKHPAIGRTKRYLGKYLDPSNDKLYKVWLVSCGLCGHPIKNKTRRVRGKQ